MASKLKGFTLVELLVVITIIGILASIGLNSFTSAQKKSRDAERKAHLKQIADSLEVYYNDKNQYPADNNNGSLMACGLDAQATCTWGTSSMENTTTNTVYMIKLPKDSTLGQSYYYDAFITNGKNTKYQLYARLENTQDIDIITVTGPQCGTKICNYGISSTNTTPTEGR